MNNNQMIHWTDSEGLMGILSDGQFNEFTSFSDTLDLPFDRDNNMPFGLVIIRDAVIEAGGTKAKPGTLGRTAQEIMHEYVTTEPVPADNIMMIVMRPENKRLHQLMTNAYLLDK